MNLFTEIESARDHWNVLRHPFYERWSEGALSRKDLAVYSGQYRHAVVALAAAAAAVARAMGSDPAARQVHEHAAEEAEHVALWDLFVESVGGDTEVPPTPETRQCVEAWAGDGQRPPLDSLVALYTIESSQPPISKLKRLGLVARYGFPRRGDATAYFDVHADRDVEHAEQQRALIEPRLDEADRAGVLGQAESALKGNWRLLDGVERLTGWPDPRQALGG